MLVTKDAFTGSLSFARPALNHLFIVSIGNDSSSANACKVLGATKIDPKADENVEAAKPKGINNIPQKAISPITN